MSISAEQKADWLERIENLIAISNKLAQKPLNQGKPNAVNALVELAGSINLVRMVDKHEAGEAKVLSSLLDSLNDVEEALVAESYVSAVVRLEAVRGLVQKDM